MPSAQKLQRPALAALLTVSALCVGAVLIATVGVDAIPARSLLIAASTGFVVTALVAGGLRSAAGRLMTLGLVGCWFGDYLIAKRFEAGALAFLLAHLLFCAAFLVGGLSGQRIRTALQWWLVVSGAVAVWLVPRVPAETRPLVVGYCVAITVMVVLACGLDSWDRRHLALMGAVFFYVSDIFVARGHFIAPSPWNALGCYPLYYGGCFLLALSSGGRREGGPEDA